MNPHEIEVHIQELVLHGFVPGDRWRIGDALEHELRGLLTTKGIPPAWLTSPEQIDAGTIRATGLTNPRLTGEATGRAIHRGGEK